MRHPALTRIFAIVLAILSLVMLTAGALGISGAREDRDGAEEDYERLQGRVEEYRTVLQQLQGTTSYDKVSQELEQKQEAHDSEASQHKSDLAMYSATKSGINTGEAALRQAESALDQGWEQYNQGFEQLQQGLTALDSSIAQSVDVNNQLTKFMSMSPSLPAVQTVELPSIPSMPETSPSPEATPDPETTPETTPEVTPTPETSPSSEPVAELLAASLPGGMLPEGSFPSGMLPEGSLQGGGLPSGGTMDVYMKDDLVRSFNDLADAYDQLDQFLSGASGLLGGLGATGALPEEQAAMLQGAQAGLDAMAAVDPKNVANSIRENLGMFDSVPTPYIPAASIGTELQASFAGISTIQEQIRAQGMEALLPTMTETLRAAKKQLQEASGQLAQGRTALEQGDAQLAAGKAELQATENELKQDGQRLDQEKVTLEQEAQNLEKLKEQAKQQQELEQRETSLRLMLMDREGIQERVDGGMELLSSAEDYSYQLQRESQEEYMNRFITCVIMIVGGLAGFACIPAAFEKLKSRFMLIAPAILSLLCAIAAETIFEVIGRGSSYSAIFAGIFAALYLLIVVPKAKKPAPRTE